MSSSSGSVHTPPHAVFDELDASMDDQLKQIMARLDEGLLASADNVQAYEDDLDAIVDRAINGCAAPDPADVRRLDEAEYAERRVIRREWELASELWESVEVPEMLERAALEYRGVTVELAELNLFWDEAVGRSALGQEQSASLASLALQRSVTDEEAHRSQIDVQHSDTLENLRALLSAANAQNADAIEASSTLLEEHRDVASDVRKDARAELAVILDYAGGARLLLHTEQIDRQLISTESEEMFARAVVVRQRARELCTTGTYAIEQIEAAARSKLTTSAERILRHISTEYAEEHVEYSKTLRAHKAQRAELEGQEEACRDGIAEACASETAREYTRALLAAVAIEESHTRIGVSMSEEEAARHRLWSEFCGGTCAIERNDVSQQQAKGRAELEAEETLAITRLLTAEHERRSDVYAAAVTADSKMPAQDEEKEDDVAAPAATRYDADAKANSSSSSSSALSSGDAADGDRALADSSTPSASSNAARHPDPVEASSETLPSVEHDVSAQVEGEASLRRHSRPTAASITDEQGPPLVDMEPQREVDAAAAANVDRAAGTEHRVAMSHSSDGEPPSPGATTAAQSGYTTDYMRSSAAADSTSADRLAMSNSRKDAQKQTTVDEPVVCSSEAPVKSRTLEDEEGEDDGVVEPTEPASAPAVIEPQHPEARSPSDSGSPADSPVDHSGHDRDAPVVVTAEESEVEAPREQKPVEAPVPRNVAPGEFSTSMSRAPQIMVVDSNSQMHELSASHRLLPVASERAAAAPSVATVSSSNAGDASSSVHPQSMSTSTVPSFSSSFGAQCDALAEKIRALSETRRKAAESMQERSAQGQGAGGLSKVAAQLRKKKMEQRGESLGRQQSDAFDGLKSTDGAVLRTPVFMNRSESTPGSSTASAFGVVHVRASRPGAARSPAAANTSPRFASMDDDSISMLGPPALGPAVQPVVETTLRRSAEPPTDDPLNHSVDLEDDESGGDGGDGQRAALARQANKAAAIKQAAEEGQSEARGYSERHPLFVFFDVLFVNFALLSCSIALFQVHPRGDEFSDSITNEEYLLSYNIVVTLFTWTWMWSRTHLARRKGEWEVIDDLPTIRSHYLWTWFAYDLLYAVPIDFIFVVWNWEAYRWIQLRHFLRLARIFNLGNSHNPLMSTRLWFRFMSFCYIMLLTAHVLGCIFWWIEEDYSYEQSLYWAVATMTSVGYGDVTPKTIDGRIYVCFAMFFGIAMLSTMTAFATSFLTDTDRLSQEEKSKKEMMYAMLEYYEVPWDVQKDVIAAVPAMIEKDNEAEFRKMTSKLPIFVAEKIDNFVRVKMLRGVPLFEDITDIAALLALSKCLKQHFFPVGDAIVEQGADDRAMFFIMHGVVEMVLLLDPEDEDGDGNFEAVVVSTLHPGAHFGEESLFQVGERPTTAQAVTVVETLVLTHEAYRGFASEHRRTARNIRRRLKQKDREDNKAASVSKAVNPLSEVPDDESPAASPRAGG